MGTNPFDKYRLQLVCDFYNQSVCVAFNKELSKDRFLRDATIIERTNFDYYNRHWANPCLLIRMLHLPFKLPDSLSKWLLGGLLRSRSQVASSNICIFLNNGFRMDESLGNPTMNNLTFIINVLRQNQAWLREVEQFMSACEGRFISNIVFTFSDRYDDNYDF